MKNNLIKGLALVGAFLCFSMAKAQTVSGTVSDATGPLPGANVLVKGTSNGTQTDFDGNYTLDNVDATATLVFSYVGFTSKEVAVNGQSTINATLTEDAQALDEVVVIGYGTTTKKDATGAVETVKAEDFNKGVVTSPDQLIQGRVAGVQITQSSGEPGGASNIRIRGTSSIRAGNDPLVVVDGIPLGGGGGAGSDIGLGRQSARNPLSFINPNDIASMDVLKDASATAIYGSRGANGVIIITTKKGKIGKPQINFNTSVQFGTISKEYDLIEANEYPSIAASVGNTNPDLGARIDPFESILRTSFTQQHDFSYGAASESGNYRFSIGYLDQEGIIKGTGQQRYSGNVNITQRAFNDIVTFDSSIIYSYIRDDGEAISDNVGAEGDLLSSALRWNPTRPFYNTDGTYNQPSDNQRNPLALLDYYEDNTETSRILANFGTTIKITDGLKYKLNIGVGRNESTRRAATSSLLNTNNTLGRGIASYEDNYNFNKLFEHTLSYKKDLSDNFNLDAVIGYSYQSFEAKGNRMVGRDFSVTDQDIYIKDIGYAATIQPTEVSGYFNPSFELQSFFGRANINYKSKYLLTATLRADGSSKFGENNQYGYFPSVGAAWRLTEEGFLPEAISEFKLRGSWGITGNQEFPAGSAQTQFGPTGDGTALQQDNVANPNLQWESVAQWGIGFDYGFLNNRIKGSVDYFNRTTNDLLFRLPAIQPAPNVNYWTNFDDIEVLNSGFEFSINAGIIETEDFTFDVSYNMAFLENKIKNVSNQFPLGIPTGEINGRSLSGQRAQLLYDNQPLYEFYLPIFEGYDAAGLPIYKDTNGDGVVNPNFDGPGGASDRDFVGDPNPDITIGIALNARYKNFDMGANLNGAYGHQIFDNTNAALFYKGAVTSGDNATYQEVNSGAAETGGGPFLSTKDLQSGDFLRLNNLTVGYTLDSQSISTNWIQSLRFYVTGQNLFVITPYDGFDPEVNTNKEVDGVPSFGIDYTSYPRSRGFVIGLNANF
ncbi:TonB-linked outer membrane protein, SusC/RagA family [Galbibacter orientalis DSM 19592]|uniref:TonB-linked outer membrane protein, SusC/RagA family n=1 Tax=Galbibacter orientalis DSM 19592 TaxID=926559 RepID=I3C240_9FLAO|nr:TonB-dependent receptor [Galbibacter orientalis]EIJ37683.1 TonB-linked outer membrane protein, SusC/RagA family [Galbibacter orientalis DSM 19592]